MSDNEKTKKLVQEAYSAGYKEASLPFLKLIIAAWFIKHQTEVITSELWEQFKKEVFEES